jgi:uncharacterized protein (TIGR02996 family)
MSEEQAFLHAIAEDPGDDAHRLIFADWLEDHGQSARAAFLRAQLRAASLPEDDPARDAAEDEADDLLAENEKEWLGDVGEWALEWEWRRGGIEHVTVRGDMLLEHGKELFEQAPIRSLRLLAQATHMQRLAECDFLNHVEWLDLATGHPTVPYQRTWHRDGPLMTLLASRHLTKLSRLALAGQGIEGPLIQRLLNTGLLNRLVRLDLRNNRSVGDRAMRTLAKEGAERLQQLDVSDTNLTGAGLHELLSAPGLPGLKEVNFDLATLFRNGMTSEAIQRESAGLARLTSVNGASGLMNRTNLIPLLQVLRPERLAHLTLADLRIEVEQMERLAACPNLAGLRSLSFMRMQLCDSEARALASSPYLGRLTCLNLAGNTIGGPGIRALMQAPTLAHVRELNLSGNYVGTTGAETIMATDRPRRLQTLELTDCNLNAESARLFARSPALSRLRVLRLTNNHLGDEGVKALAGCSHLRRLRELDLGNNDIDSAGAQAILHSPYLTRLVRLGLKNAFIGIHEREVVRARFGEGVKF